MLCSPLAGTLQGLTFLCLFSRPPVTLPLCSVPCQKRSVPAHPPPICNHAGQMAKSAFQGGQAVKNSLLAATNYWDHHRYDCIAALTRASCTTLLLILLLLAFWREPGSPKEILQYGIHCKKPQLRNCWKRKKSGHLVGLSQELGAEVLCKGRRQTLAGFVLPAKLWWAREGFVMGLSH